MATDHLFKLVKSLSKNEKVYIKRNAALHKIGGKNKYIKLFDVLCDMKVYDENFIRLRFASDPFFNNLSAAKNYLLNFILHNLESYHQTIYSEVRSCLHQIEILEDKGLIALCRKRLARAEFLVNKYELVDQMFAVYNWKYHLYPAGQTRKEFRACIKEIDGDMQRAIELTKELAEVKRQCFHVMEKSLYINPEGNKAGLEEVEEEIGRQEQTSSSHYHSFAAKYNYITGMRILYTTVMDSEQALRYTDETNELFFRNPHMIELETFNMLFSLREKVHFEFAKGHYEMVLETFRLLDKMERQYGTYKKIVSILLQNMKLVSCLKLGQFESALDHAERFEKYFEEIEMSQIHSDEQKMFFIRASVTYFGLGKYKEALKYTNYILDTSADEMLGDLHYFAQLFQLLIYYERGEAELIEYKARSVYRNLLRKKKKFRAGKLLIDFFKELQEADAWDDETGAFIHLKKDLLNLLHTFPEEKRFLRFFYIISWIDSKILGCTLAEVLYTEHRRVFESASGRELITYLNGGVKAPKKLTPVTAE